MMRTWMFYRVADGTWSNRKASLDDALSDVAGWLARNTPPGHAAFELLAGAQIDTPSSRVDVETGLVVDYQPPQPSPDHEWRALLPNAQTRREQMWRWMKRPDLVAREQRRAQALAAIASEEIQSLRAMREALLATLPDGAAKTQLQAIDTRIQAQRDILQS